MDGVVATFDVHRGYGTVRGASGEELFFHCTRIADGSRTIEPGTPIAFEVVPGFGGRWEATAVQALPVG